MVWISKDPADYQGKGMPRRPAPASPWWVRTGAFCAAFTVILVAVVLAGLDPMAALPFAYLPSWLAQWGAELAWRRRSRLASDRER